MNDRERLMERAWKLQEQAEEKGEEQARDRLMEDTVRELGVDPVYLEKARAQLAEEDARRALEAGKRAAARQRRRRAIALGVTVAGLVAGASVLGWRLMQPPAAWTEDFTAGQDRWTLDVNAGTEAMARWETESGHGSVAVIDVTRFAPAEDGRFRANLNDVAERDLSGYQTLSVAVRGEGLGTVRVFLERPDERWRSPPMAVEPDWKTYRLPLSAFERQTRQGGWKVTGWAAPGEVQTISFKVGHYMNELMSHGRVYIDDLHLE